MLKILSAIIWIFSKSFQLSESIITKGLIRLNILHVLIIRLLFKSIQKRSNWIVFLRAKSRKCSNSMKERSIDQWILDLGSETKTFLFFPSFRSCEKSKRDDEWKYRCEEQFLYLPLLFDEYRLYVTSSGTNSPYTLSLQRREKEARFELRKRDAIIFSKCRIERRIELISCNQRCDNVDILNVYPYLNNIIYKHFTLKLFSIAIR